MPLGQLSLHSFGELGQAKESLRGKTPQVHDDGLQNMLDICVTFGAHSSIMFNAMKSTVYVLLLVRRN